MDSPFGVAAIQLLEGVAAGIFGYTIGFFTLAAIALGGLSFFALLMPETRSEEILRLEPPKVRGN
jgi:hypothetical protein